MLRYTGKRILIMIPVILGIIIFIFTLMYCIPGDPVDFLLPSDATEADREALREQMGLNDSYIEQLLRYVKQVVFEFDLGKSYLSGVSISKEVAERLPRTLILGFSCIFIAVAVGIPLGVDAAVHQGTARDWIPLSLALVGVSMPGFWVALMLVLLFSVKLGWLPSYGMGGFQYWILPIVSSAIHGIATIARQTRSSMLDVLNADYITTARSKGMSEHNVIYKHALPNALIPIVQIVGTQLARIFGRGVMIETIFSIPGVGYYMTKAVKNRDYPAAEGSVLMVAIVFCTVMLCTDLVMAMINPRIKAQFVSRAAKKRKLTSKNKEIKVNG